MRLIYAYRFIPTILGVCILLGATMPSGLHTASMEICQMMDMGHDDHSMPDNEMPPMGHEDCPMDKDETSSATPLVTQHSAFHNGLICACDIDEAPLDTEVPLSKKVNAQVLLTVQLILDQQPGDDNTTQGKFTLADSFSPPPIFLTNASFLI